MSAAEPADPARPHVNTTRGGAVIDITKRSRHGGGAAAQARGRWTAMTAPPPGHGPDRTPIELVADDVEKWFNTIRRTLADEDTAQVFVHSVDFVGHILKAAAARHVITEDERLELDELLAAARQAPEHI